MKKFLSLLLFTASMASAGIFAQVSDITKAIPAQKKVLIVLTSTSKIGDTGEKTGYHLAEVSHAWNVFTNAGYIVDFVSPLGGNAPADAIDLTDPVNAKLWNDPEMRKRLESTIRPVAVMPAGYSAIYFAGGHGAMWDFPENKELQEITATIYKNYGVVGAVCHGPAGLINVKLEDGAYLVDGKTVNSFTNEEEIQRNMDKTVPFLLEDKLVERGARFEQSAEFTEHVAVDGRLVTGQNPASATAVAEEMVKLINAM